MLIVLGCCCFHYSKQMKPVRNFWDNAELTFGAISRNAALALNQGAKKGNFAHNTGEGGISAYRLEAGDDLVW